MLLNLLYNKISKKNVFVIVLVLFVLGQIFNLFSPHNLFHANQVMLLVMFVIQIIVLKEIRMEKAEIKKCIMTKNEPEVSGLFNGKIEKILHSVIGEIISFMLVVLYIITMFALGCLEITITGIYGGILGGLVFYIGIQAYIHYIALLYFAYDLRHIQIIDYAIYFPALTNWIRRLAREFSYIEKWFLSLGLMYSIIYAINLPKDTIFVDFGIKINSNCNILLIITWSGILILFAMAFPVFTFLSRTFIKDVIYNCKCISINNIEKQLFALSNQPTEEDVILIERLISLAKTISESDDYPLKYSQTIFDKAYTIAIALITLISPFLSIAEKIIFKS